jgi:hypothetical protein
MSRDKRRYHERLSDLQYRNLTLDDVTQAGNLTTRGAYFDGDLEATGYVKGDAIHLTNLPSVTAVTGLTLDDVVTNGNVCTVSGAKFNGDLEASGFIKGNGSLLTNLGYMTSTGLDDATAQGSSTNRKISFTNAVTSLETSGNVLVSGNVTCSQPLKGNGEFLTGVANSYNLSLVNTSVTSVEGKKIITNTSSLTNVTQGDILISTVNGTLGKLPIGANGKVLYSNPTSLQPEWKTFTDIFNVSSRTSTLESKAIFAGTPNLSSLTTGDILYGYANNDIRRLSRVTTAPNTHLTYGDYGTGYGRLLRVDEWGENVMWLHPSNYTQNSGNIPLFISGTSGTLNYITIELRTDKVLRYITPGRIPIASGAAPSDLLFSLRFNDSMFYSENGRSYSGTGSTKHPSGIKWKLYTQGDLYANYIHGDGSKMVFPTGPTSIGGSTFNASGASSLGKAGQLLVFSDKRRKSKIKAMSKSLDTLSKLVPKLYEKEGKRESGFIAQEMYYGVREMRHIVWPDRDANPNDDAPEPNYSDWGKRHACLRYLHFIAYVVKSIQELKERMERLKNNRK